MALHHIFMTSQRAKILCVKFLLKTAPTETPEFLKFKTGEIMKHPRGHCVMVTLSTLDFSKKRKNVAK